MPAFNNNVKNKLLVMFFIKEMNTPILGYQLEDYFVNNVLIETIELHTILDDLKDNSFIKTETAFNNIYYTVTEKGKDALMSLEETLTETSRALIRDYVHDNRSRIMSLNNVLTNCRINGDGQYELKLTLLNDTKTLLEVKLLLDDEDFAVNATKRWSECSNEVYTEIIKQLMVQASQH